MIYVFVALIVLVETTAIALLKKFHISRRAAYFATGYAFYLCVCLLLIQTFQYAGMGIVNTLWSAFSVIMVVIVGNLCYKERVTRNEIAGMCLILAGVALLPS